LGYSLKGDEDQIGGFDCIFRNERIKLDTKSMFSSNLGCHNNRITQLKKLAKCTAARLGQQYAIE
jgi:hypothetical protein